MSRSHARDQSQSSPKPSRYSGWIGFVLIAVALGLSGLKFYRQKAKQVRQRQHQLIAAVGELKSGQIQSWRNERLADARRVARGLVMRRQTAAWVHNPGASLPRTELLEVLNTNKVANNYDSTHLIALDGRMLLSSEATPAPVTPATQAGIRAAVRGDGPVFSEFFRDADGGTYLDVVTCVREPSGRPLAAVVLRSRADGYLFPLIQKWPLPSRSAETVLTVRSGDEALVPHRLRAEAEDAQPWHRPLTDTQFPSVQMVLGKRGVTQGVDYRGKDVLADLRVIPNSPWFIHCKIDKDEAFAELHSDALFISMITGAFILLAASAFAYSYRQRQAKHFKERYEAEQLKLEAEGSLRASEELLSQVSERLSLAIRAGGVGIWEWDVTRNRLLWDAQMYRLYGISADHSGGAFEAWRGGLHPEDAAQGEAETQMALRGEKEFDTEFRVIWPDGSLHSIRGMAIVQRDADGQALRMIGTNWDITAQKQTEAALKASEATLLQSQSIAGLGSYTLDIASGRWTSSEVLDGIFGIEGDHDHSVANWIALIHPEWQDTMARYFAEEVVGSGRPFNKEYKIVRLNDGAERWVHGQGELGFNEQGEPIRMLGTIMDITERRQAETQNRQLEAMLHHSQKMESLGLLAGGVAHDMNNVLAAILGLSSAHLELQPEGSATRRAFDTIVKACARGGTLVKGLLSISRRGLSEEVVLDLNVLIQEEVQLLEHTTLAKVRLDMDLAADLPAILGDGGALSHALMNLCVNAVDAMPDGGRLTFRTRPVGEQVEVTVEDTGQGMAPGVLEKALEPFFTTKAQGKGTGLGLSIVYSIVKAHRGEVEMLSQPGEGTRIVLRFPAHVPPPPSPDLVLVGDTEHPSKKASPSMHVLLVDDDELVSSAVSELIELLGYATTPAFSGEEALDILRGGLAVDAVILDLNMPGLGGAATLPRLRDLKPDLPVLLATGRVEQVVLDLVKDFPGVTLMSKPFTMKELQAHLRGAMGS